IMFGPRPDRDQEARSVVAWLTFRGTLLAEEGQPDEALDDCRRILAVAGVADAEPYSLSGIVCLVFRRMAVGMIERVLAQGEPQPDALRQVQNACEKELAR